VYTLSRIGKMPIQIPSGVDVKLEDGTVVVKGPKGTLRQIISPEIICEIKDKTISFSPITTEYKHKAKWGLYRVLVNNMIVGVTAGYQKDLEIIGVGYKAEMKGKDLNVLVGYSHPVYFKAVEGVAFSVESGTKINIKGIDKQLIGQMAADIRRVRKPEPYKGKGIRYTGEVVRKKAGKTGTK
jgi:large subunit ribosomal protein L6